MRSKIILLVLAGSILCVTSWLVHMPPPTQAEEIPEKYQGTVNKALEYLVKQQHKDGHWEGDGGKHPVAMTGLVGIALLMERTIHPSRGLARPHQNLKYAEQIRKASDWLISQSKPGRDGLIYSNHASETSRYMQGHGFAAMFLAGALRSERDEARRKKLTEVLTAAVKYIAKAQSSQGGWYDTSRVEGHDFESMAATVIQLQALQAAEVSGIPIPSEARSDAYQYMRATLEKYDMKQKGKAEPDRVRQLETAATLAYRYPHHERAFRSRVPPKDMVLEKLKKYCQDEIPTGKNLKFGRDELIHYYWAQALFNDDAEAWDHYRTSVFDQLQAKQDKDGSWPSSEGIGTGRVYATAIWCALMQLDKRSHPSRPDDMSVDITLLWHQTPWELRLRC